MKDLSEITSNWPSSIRNCMGKVLRQCAMFKVRKRTIEIILGGQLKSQHIWKGKINELCQAIRKSCFGYTFSGDGEK